MSDHYIEKNTTFSKDDLKGEVKNTIPNYQCEEQHLLMDNKLREIKNTTDRQINP